MKQIWNKIREKSASKETRANLVNNILQIIQNHIVEITLRHDASRIIQTVIQFGNDRQREMVLNELLPKFYEIAKSPYGHFTILKMITYGNTPEFMKKICQGLKHHFVSLGIHSIGARTVETVLQLYSSSYTKHLKAEYYGKVRFYVDFDELKLLTYFLIEFRCFGARNSNFSSPFDFFTPPEALPHLGPHERFNFEISFEVFSGF
jgi:hypothetical protein